jgi:hypothetical protein
MTKHATAEELLAHVTQTVRRADRYAAIELLSKHDPQLAAEVYEKLQLDLYWKQKNLPAMVAFSQAGIQHCLTEAGNATDNAVARSLRGAAKHLAYNLASFTWPGWNEAGIVITNSDLAVGLEAARLNVRLAEELDRPQKARANALWTLGAQQLAAGDYSQAGETFCRAKSHAEQADAAALVRMLEGYVLLSQSLAQPAGGNRPFNSFVESLRADGSQEAKEYADQLSVAMSVFQKPG